MASPSQRRGVPLREKHGWLRFDRYREIHESALERHPFVLEDGTAFTRLVVDGGAVIYVLEGDITCHADIIVSVSKTLEVRQNRGLEQVRAVHYNYNAYIPGQGNVLRYDNSHLDAPDEYHRHEYDLDSGEEIGRRALLTREQFPTLIEAVTEIAGIIRAAGLR